MTIDHISELHGLPVYDFPRAGEEDGPLPAAETVAWRLARDPFRTDEESFDLCWERFLDTVDPARVRALVLGAGAYGTEDSGDDPEETAERLAAAAGRLTGLRALYLADLTFEEAELSWIVQGDVSPVLAAYPRLEELAVRGSNGGFEDEPGLRLTPLRHEHLRVLRFENGGLPREVVQGLVACDLPRLERLDLWLGDEYYGRTTTVADLAPLLAGDALPALRHLGLQNSDVQDEVAAAVATAPVVARLTSLHLGLGTLGDAGAEALLTGQPLTHLEELDLHHHFLSDPMMRRLREALEPFGVEVDLGEQEKADEDGSRYTAAGE
ncbi:STM4015 family protein [Streptomyces minutiscleroticus]|uniref:STM4015 family protein n=1 Tax=Streptomyces minutiscleroticus TaxID=68238 RepID=UPI00167DE740|nr:STM4015 family protein [Streptomyces minutiscleroticus]